MPRVARRKGETGIYHIIIRGINRQIIFHDNKDRLRFLEILYRYKRTVNLDVLGWCLMDNHVHLLLGEGDEDISVTMKRIGISYANYYHRKYDTVGHLLQDRFKSEAVDNDLYLLAVIRYIHQNPVKAGIVDKPAEWNWSSCRGYYGDADVHLDLLNPELILNIFDLNDNEQAIIQFKKFNENYAEETCLEYTTGNRLSNKEAREEIKKAISDMNIDLIKSLPKAQRNTILAKVKQIEGISQRQAAEILGISPSIIFKA